MTHKPTLFVVTDIETTYRKRIAFDIAWQTIDRRGRVYSKGSYVIPESFQVDIPFYKEKLGFYFEDTFAKLIQPAAILDVRKDYNDQIALHRSNGHRIILCAYNAAFDFKYLPETCGILTDGLVTRWLDKPAELLDIWHHWGDSVPLHYQADPSDSGKYLKTSAEAAYRFEFCQPKFIERHIAWHDVEIESDLLVRALSRKKTMHVVKSPAEFVGGIWKRINTRLGVTGKESLTQPEGEMVGA